MREGLFTRAPSPATGRTPSNQRIDVAGWSAGRPAARATSPRAPRGPSPEGSTRSPPDGDWAWHAPCAVRNETGRAVEGGTVPRDYRTLLAALTRLEALPPGPEHDRAVAELRYALRAL